VDDHHNLRPFTSLALPQIGQFPSRIATNLWNYENQRAPALLHNGQRETMTYDADLRQHSREV
jgi:hypothetical protein